MARFRLAVSIKAYLDNPDRTKRPNKPAWLRSINEMHSTRNQRRSFEYWTQIYWATPPWITESMISQMAIIYRMASESEHVDHIVPLKSNIVCGLHVPWNLKIMGAKQNQVKSNHMWPGHPAENQELFNLEPEPYQMKLCI